jgi:hypothetical protein
VLEGKLIEIKLDNSAGEVSRGEKMLQSGTDPETYITEHTIVYEGKTWIVLEGDSFGSNRIM